jgi:hypothetical protein
MKFFINYNTTAYLRNLASEFDESTNAIRLELNRFEEADLLRSETVQNKKVYQANTEHPYFRDLHRLLLKYVGIDKIIEELITRVGNLEKAYVINDFAKGKPGKILDLMLVGYNFDTVYIDTLIEKTEANVHFKIHYQTILPELMPEQIQDLTKILLVWSAE